MNTVIEARHHIASLNGSVLSQPILLSWLVIILAGIFLCLIVAISPPEPVYDERWYLATIPLLHSHGLSQNFLVSLPVSAGPTFTITYAIIERLFGLTLPWARFASITLLGASSLLLA